jgi:hypothetical protein
MIIQPFDEWVRSSAWFDLFERQRLSAAGDTRNSLSTKDVLAGTASAGSDRMARIKFGQRVQ